MFCKKQLLYVCYFVQQFSLFLHVFFFCYYFLLKTKMAALAGEGFLKVLSGSVDSEF